jgi:hypothetical protein
MITKKMMQNALAVSLIAGCYGTERKMLQLGLC